MGIQFGTGFCSRMDNTFHEEHDLSVKELVTEQPDEEMKVELREDSVPSGMVSPTSQSDTSKLAQEFIQKLLSHSSSFSLFQRTGTKEQNSSPARRKNHEEFWTNLFFLEFLSDNSSIVNSSGDNQVFANNFKKLD